MKDKETIMKGLQACRDYCCRECPYQYLDDEYYILRCIHTLVKDVNEMLKETKDYIS